MKKTLTKHGNSLAMLIEKPILELLGADGDTPFEVTTDGRSLVLTPVHDPQREDRFDNALEQVNSQFPKTLKKLAE